MRSGRSRRCGKPPWLRTLTSLRPKKRWRKRGQRSKTTDRTVELSVELFTHHGRYIMLQRLIGFFVVIVLASVVLGQDRPKVISEREQERIKADKAARDALHHRISNHDFNDKSLTD